MEGSRFVYGYMNSFHISCQYETFAQATSFVLARLPQLFPALTFARG